MTRNNQINGYTELDIMLLRAGAPTRFDSPYWTERKVDWSAIRDVFITPITATIRAGIRMIPRPLHQNALAA